MTQPQINNSTIPPTIEQKFADEFYRLTSNTRISLNSPEKITADHVKDLDSELKQQVQSIKEQKLTSDTIYELMDLLSSEEESSIKQAKARLSSWYEAQSTLQKKMDEFTQVKHAFIAHSIMNHISEHFKHHRYNEALKIHYQAIEHQYTIWKKFQFAVGAVHPKDHMNRIYSLSAMLKEASLYFDKVKPDDPSKKSQATRRRKLRFAMHVFVNTLSIVFTKKQNRLINGLLKIAEKYGDFFDLQINIQNQDIIEGINQRLDQDESINFYLPSHREPVGDVFLLNRLKVKKPIIFANAWEVAGFAVKKGQRRLAQTLASFPDAVAVGRAKDFKQRSTTEKILCSLEKKVSQNIINYPQGFTGNFHEILPVNRNFNRKLIRKVLDKGLRARIIPISFEIESEVLGHKPTAKQAAIKVHQPLSEDFVEFLSKEEQEGMPGLIGHILRAIWFDHTTIFPELSLEEINHRIKKEYAFSILG